MEGLTGKNLKTDSGNLKLWKQFEEWKRECYWVDLSHELSPDTPHWVGWDALTVEEKMNLDNSIFAAHAYTTVGQYGTHVDAPVHMVKGGRTLSQVGIHEMVMPMCIINKEEACNMNPDYILTVQDILDWEMEYGKIPEGAFVVFQSGWSKRDPETMDNLDDDGNRHFPGWSKEAVEFLVHQRNIASIGHETSDTEAPITSGKTNYEVEYYMLAQDRIQLEMLCNLDKCPPVGSIAFCTFPNVLDGTGYPARVFALCEKEME
ncbi:cyclase family protein [Lachnospiraceae bacterium OttesenSCG-928-D06]|nr:cyclase family protein [Lachnospiraceae bacterium OttesenSCG-928-D06]